MAGIKPMTKMRNALLLMGFQLDPPIPHTLGCRDAECYFLDVGRRRVDVQLWQDGRHRASHWVRETLDPNRMSMNTYPTDFEDGEEMLHAIVNEMTRMDNRNWKECPDAGD